MLEKCNINRCKSADFTPSQAFLKVRQCFIVPLSVLYTSCLGAFVQVRCLCKTIKRVVAAVHVTATWQEPVMVSASCLQLMDGITM